MTLHIIGIDPGETTGLAQLVDGEWYFKELGPEPHHAALWKFLDSGGAPDYVVCERFTPRPNNKAALYISLEYIGVAKAWSEMNGRTLHLQNASDAKATWTNDKLKRLQIPNLPRAHPAHMRDALRHILLFVQKELGISTYLKQATWTGE